jgi:hypothetical protein
MIDPNQLIYQLRSKMDWHTKLSLVQKFRSEGESKMYQRGWDDCLLTLNKAKQNKNKLYENEFKQELEKLEEFIYTTKEKKEAIKIKL